MTLTFYLVAYPFLRGKRQFTRKTTTLHTHHAFLYILLLSLHDYDVKMLNFSYCGGRELKTKTLFFFSRTSLHYFRILLQKTILAGMERFWSCCLKIMSSSRSRKGVKLLLRIWLAKLSYELTIRWEKHDLRSLITTEAWLTTSYGSFTAWRINTVMMWPGIILSIVI